MCSGVYVFGEDNISGNQHDISSRRYRRLTQKKVKLLVVVGVTMTKLVRMKEKPTSSSLAKESFQSPDEIYKK